MGAGGGIRTIVHPPPLQAGKAAFRALIAAYGGQDAAAIETGRSQSRLCAYGLPNTPDFAPLDIVVALEASTHGLPGHPPVTRWMARQAGYILVPRPTSGTEGVWGTSLKQLSKEFGEVAERVCHALADPESPGEVTAVDIRRLGIVAELDDLIERASAMRAQAAHTVEVADTS